MTEDDWNYSTEPQEMLEALRASGRATERRLRLFACACVRRFWDELDETKRRAVHAVERYADGLLSQDDVSAAYEAFLPDLARTTSASGRGFFAGAAVSYLFADARVDPVAYAMDLSPWAAGADESYAVAHTTQASYLRCIIGPALFRPLPPVAPAVLVWNGGMVGRLAAGVYEARDFTQGRLGVLADAAEEAGLDDADVLAHLRSPGPHVRGCHVIDLLLGRE
jgi:hypothetical protein